MARRPRRRAAPRAARRRDAARANKRDPALALGAAAHEIKNALGPLGMTLELAERRLVAGEPIPREDLAFSRAQVRRLSALVNDLLDVTQIDVIEMPVRPVAGDLGALAREAVEIFRRGTARAVALEVPADPVPALFDPDRLTQLLLNLLDNAAKYAPPPAPITVALGRAAAGATARIEVRDGGPGLSTAEQRSIFRRFSRARTVGDGTRGLGLGLYLCREIARRHGARIGVTSTPGQGATFWLELRATKSDRKTEREA
jgi:signal transduction histidine kinase